MRKSNFIKLTTITLVGCMLFSSLPVSATSTSPSENKTVVGTDIPFDYDKYIDIHSELDGVMAKIRKYSEDTAKNEPALFSATSNNEYDTLLEERDALLEELDSIGANLDLETLSKFPAPTSNQTSAQTRSDLTGNLADLAEYYENWFEFTGYEQDVTYNGNTYTACVVTVRDIAGNSGLLTSAYNEVDLITKSKSATAEGIAEIFDTGFGIFADELSGLLDWGRVKSWVVSNLFSDLVKLMDSGTIIINSSDSFYEYKIGLETNLYFGYIWDDSADEWVYCASSGKVYVDEEHTLNYMKFNGGSGSQYTWDAEGPISINYSLTTLTPRELCSVAAQLYSDSGDSTPYYNECYQLYELEVKRQWGGNGAYKSLGNDFVFNPVCCDSPGDLWTLGSLN